MGFKKGEQRSKSQPHGRRKLSARALAIRRARSEPRSLRENRRGLDERSRGASWAEGLVGKAQARLEEGNLEGARASLDEARNLATTVTLAPVLAKGSPGLGETPNASAQPSQRQGLRAQIQALAGSELDFGQEMGSRSSLPPPVGRPLRACEEQQLQQTSATVMRTAHGVLMRCDDLAVEVARRELAQ